MIISHHKKFLFVKTKKVAGSSVTDWLRRYLSKGDFDYLALPLREHKFYAHHPVGEILESEYAHLFQDYYTFTILRHPYDRLLSQYHFSWRGDFWSFLQSSLAQETCNYNIVTHQEKLAPFDKIVFYENLLEGLQEVAEKIGAPSPKVDSFPRRKTRYRRERVPWKEVFSQEQIFYCRRAFPKEVALHRCLGYEV